MSSDIADRYNCGQQLLEESKLLSNSHKLLLVIINVAFLWWISPLVLNLTKPQFILRAISWSALRATQPGAAAYFAIKASRNPEERLRLYFDGMPIHGAKKDSSDPDKPTKMPWYMIILHMCIDAGFTLYPALSLLTRRWGCKVEKGEVQPAVLLWVYPTVPAAVFGLWITLDAKVLRSSKRWSMGLAYVMILGMGILLFIPVFRTFNKTKTPAILPAFAYLIMAIPVGVRTSSHWTSFCWGLIACFYATAARNLPVAFGAFTYDGDSKLDLPFPDGANPIGFGVSYLAVGVLCSLLGIWGLYMTDGPRDHLIKVHKDEREQLETRSPDNMADRSKQVESHVSPC